MSQVRLQLRRVPVSHVHQPAHFALLLHQQVAHSGEAVQNSLHVCHVRVFGWIFLGVNHFVGEVDLKGCIVTFEDKVELVIFEVMGLVEDPKLLVFELPRDGRSVQNSEVGIPCRIVIGVLINCSPIDFAVKHSPD